MDVPNEWRRQLRTWAGQHDPVRQLWIFGSRVKGGARPDSDLDIAIALMPPKGNHDWAFGDYVALKEKWQTEIETLIGCKISFGAIEPGSELDIEVRVLASCYGLDRDGQGEEVQTPRPRLTLVCAVDQSHAREAPWRCLRSSEAEAGY